AEMRVRYSRRPGAGGPRKAWSKAGATVSDPEGSGPSSGIQERGVRERGASKQPPSKRLRSARTACCNRCRSRRDKRPVAAPRKCDAANEGDKPDGERRSTAKQKAGVG